MNAYQHPGWGGARGMTTVYINRGVNREFRGRVRMKLQRRWFVLKPRVSKELAIVDAVKRMTAGNWDYCDVIFTSDWYEPVVIFEGKKS